MPLRLQPPRPPPAGLLLLPVAVLLLMPVGRGLAAPACGFAPCPSWPQTWNITRSTIIMPCNFSGYFDYKIAGRFAVVDVSAASR